jgi:UPF0176 protein
METITVSSFYHFTPLAHPAAHKPALLARMQELGVRGTVTLASEGVNATVSGVEISLVEFIGFLQTQLGIALPMKRISHASAQPFQRSKVKVKPELISLGEIAEPSVCVGQYVRPSEWNALIQSADVITIDVRNDYEFQLGHFAGAINPGTRHFKQMVAFTRDHPDVNSGKKIAMYCTGGIRCEKYSAYLLGQGFSEVYHLEGGILAYLEQIPAAQSLWQGECFVFDERVALSHGLFLAHSVAGV